MSKDCYVKQYKGSVSADLEKFNVLTFVVVPTFLTSASMEFDIRRYVGHKMSWTGDVTITQGGVLQTSPITITNTVYVGNTGNGGNIEIEGMYDMNGDVGGNLNMFSTKCHPKYFDTLKAIAPWWKGTVNSGNPNPGDDYWHLKGSLSDIADFVKKDTIETLVLSNCGIESNLSELPTLTGATTLGLAANTKVIGDIATLGEWTGLTTLNLDSTGVTGTIESLVAAQRTAGRTTGSIKIYAPNTSITYNGSAAGTHTYTWDAQGNITVS